MFILKTMLTLFYWLLNKLWGIIKLTSSTGCLYKPQSPKTRQGAKLSALNFCGCSCLSEQEKHE